ncbi:elongation factor 4 [bacterium]|nr:elongation factor 4 [bacterium]
MIETIRNFCIIAHIDHGKSTLADRLIEQTHTVSKRDMKHQLLDSMDLERERGITIKMQAVRLQYHAQGHPTPYTLNLIDTPGHVDFSYEVSRSLAACEGALLLVDATQGIEAQTLANFYLALEHNLEIIPVINKIDLPSADPDRVAEEIERVLGIPAQDAIRCSAKTGRHIEQVLEAVVAHIPCPTPDPEDKLKALIFDAHFDPYRGVIIYVRVMSGTLQRGQKISLMAAGSSYDILDIGYFKPKMTPSDGIQTGEVGYIVCNIKSVSDAQIGDTVTDHKQPAQSPLPGYQKAKPMVFCGLYPVDTEEYPALRDALEKLTLNDSALQFVPESSQALGFGYRCGFLGLLHMEIVQQRIEREYGIELVATAPNVTYRITRTNGDVMEIENPNEFLSPQLVAQTEEPCMGLSIITPSTFLGTVIELAQEHRGEYKKAELIDADRQMLTFSIPLNELITSFFDKLKSRTKGYASMDYWFEGYRPAKLVKVDMLINGDPVDALSFIAHASKAAGIARKMAEKLKELIPRQLYEVALQGAIGGKIIARESISALKKNVIAKCYGGDITRKRKLIEKQKKGKKKMKMIGSVEVPKEAFLSVLKLSD